jgi:hypothetical protein
MDCDFCKGTGKVARVGVGSYDDVDAYVYIVDRVTCPKCIRGVTVLGAHEMLRDWRGGIHRPGERVDDPTGTFLTGIIRTDPS